MPSDNYTTVRVKVQVRALLGQLAKVEGRSMPKVLEQAVEDYAYRKRKGRNRPAPPAPCPHAEKVLGFCRNCGARA